MDKQASKQASMHACLHACMHVYNPQISHQLFLFNQQQQQQQQQHLYVSIKENLNCHHHELGGGDDGDGDDRRRRRQTESRLFVTDMQHGTCFIIIMSVCQKINDFIMHCAAVVMSAKLGQGINQSVVDLNCVDPFLLQHSFILSNAPFKKLTPTILYNIEIILLLKPNSISSKTWDYLQAT
uniref:Uncharacterized protein n=1 Tax=Glossina brevipalpis TaxID=37001 RepID=A0A1A9WU92_9MUSC